MRLDINVSDEISPAIQYALENNKDFIRKATKAVGYWVQKEIKAGLKDNKYSLTSMFEKRSPYGIRRKLAGHAPTSWYGKMKNAIGYEYINDGVNIGWTSAKASFYGKVQEFGTTRQVTMATRALYRKAGVPLLNSKTQIKVPARPIFEHMSNMLQPQIANVVEEKVLHYLENGTNFGKKNRRKYKVY